MQDDSRIRERAHQIWEQAGRPDGEHQAHWLQAEREIATEGGAPGATNSDPSPTLNAPDDGGVSPGEAVSAAKAIGDDLGSQSGGDAASVSAAPAEAAESAGSSPTPSAPDGGGASPGETAAAVSAIGKRSRAKNPSGGKDGTRRR